MSFLSVAASNGCSLFECRADLSRVFLCALIFSAREFFSLWQAVEDAHETVP